MGRYPEVVLFVVVFSPLIVLGAFAWCVYTAIAIGWNIVDAVAETMAKEKEHEG